MTPHADATFPVKDGRYLRAIPMALIEPHRDAIEIAAAAYHGGLTALELVGLFTGRPVGELVARGDLARTSLECEVALIVALKCHFAARDALARVGRP